jgi:hypothetical protein
MAADGKVRELSRLQKAAIVSQNLLVADIFITYSNLPEIAFTPACAMSMVKVRHRSNVVDAEDALSKRERICWDEFD